MSTDKLVSKSDLQEFYNRILPYLGGSAEAGFTPVGTVISVMGKTAPANYLPCDGRVVNISDYPELADYFKEQFGSSNYFGGDGTTTFGIVDLSGEFLRGAGTNSHTNQGSGANVGVHQDATGHLRISSSSSTNMALITVTDAGGVKELNPDSYYNSASTFRGFTGSKTSASDLYQNYTSRPTNTSVLFCIATKNIYLNPSLDFSTSEKVVGTWVDGKPLYQKTIDFGALPNATTKTVAHSVTNMDRLVNIQGCFLDARGQMSTIPFSFPDGTTYNIGIYATVTDVSIKTGMDRSSESAYVTLQYTKTSD